MTPNKTESSLETSSDGPLVEPLKVIVLDQIPPIDNGDKIDEELSESGAGIFGTKQGNSRDIGGHNDIRGRFQDLGSDVRGKSWKISPRNSQENTTAAPINTATPTNTSNDTQSLLKSLEQKIALK